MKIEILNYNKTLSNEKILKDISLTFESGHIYGIIGKNGSGKSVLLKSICGFANIKNGQIKIDGKILGKDLEFPERLGAILDGSGFLNNFSGFKNLKLLAEINNLISDNDIKNTMSFMGLDPYSKKKYKHYSMGMKQKLSICQAIMENPEILILDEIFNALDDDTVKILRELLLKYKKENKLIILTSHIKEDISVLCDEVYELTNGSIKISNQTI
ncbi:MAG: ATP-binding cassette domain-containing protein [Sarcina sp.]